MTVANAIRSLHRYVALATGLLMIVVGLTGSAIVFYDELAAWLYPELQSVEPAQKPLPLERLLTIAKHRAGSLPITDIELPLTASEPVIFYAETGHDEFVRLFIDPYDGAILGQKSPREDVLGVLLLLHTHLLAGETGETIVGASGLILLFLVVTGVWMWWPGCKRVLRSFRVRLRPSLRFWSELHKVFGIVTAPTLVLVSITGSALIFYTVAQAFLLYITASPPRATSPAIVAPTASAQRVSLDRLLAAAEQAIPVGISTFIHTPEQSLAPVAVRKRLPQETHRNGRTFVYLNPYNAQVVHIDHALRASAGVRALNLLYPLHTGDVGGLWLRVSYVLTGVLPAVLLISGIIIWWRRRTPRKVPMARMTPP